MLTSLIDYFPKQHLSVFNNNYWDFHKPKKQYQQISFNQPNFQFVRMIFINRYCKTVQGSFPFHQNSTSIIAEKLTRLETTGNHLVQALCRLMRARHITSAHQLKLQCTNHGDSRVLEFQANCNKNMADMGHCIRLCCAYFFFFLVRIWKIGSALNFSYLPIVQNNRSIVLRTQFRRYNSCKTVLIKKVYKISLNTILYLFFVFVYFL